MLLAALCAQAQDIQVHYDFGRNLYSDTEAGRQKVTVTLEQFKADKLGSWYYFVDIDLSLPRSRLFHHLLLRPAGQHAAADPQRTHWPPQLRPD